MWEYMLDALQKVLSPMGVAFMIGGVALGVFFGALPGLSGGMVMTMLLPVTYKMDPILALELFMALHVGSCCGGAIGSILLGIPGTSSSIATTWDGYEFTKQGNAVRPLSVTVACNIFGVIPGIIIAMLCVKSLADLGVKMGPWEYCSMIFAALALVISLEGDSQIKGFIAMGLAIIVACVGVDPMLGRARFTFGITDFYDGFNIVNIMLGMFAAKIIMMEYVKQSKVKDAKQVKVDRFKWPGKDIKDNWLNIIISFILGAFIGFLPGLGGPTSSVVCYSTGRMMAKDKDQWGKGAIGGVWCPEVATKADIGGAIIPMIALGIPGDVVMVQFMTVMSVHGVTAGPTLMMERPDMVYILYVAALIASFIVFLVQVLAMPLFPRIISLPYHYLYPAIIIISFLGAYMVKTNAFGIMVAVGACILGLIMDYFNIPSMPFTMTYILASLFEKYLRQGINNSPQGYLTFLTRPASAIFLIIGVGVVIGNTIWPMIKKAKAKKASA